MVILTEDYFGLPFFYTLYWEQMDSIKAIVANITFHNEENGFTVMRVKADNYKSAVICLGILPAISKGEKIEAYGNWATDPKYGKQFKISHYKSIIPETSEGILSLMESGLIKGIGPSRAKDIINKFGDKTLDILDKDPNQLLKVNGIGKSRLKEIVASWSKGKEVRELIIFLKDYDFSLPFINKIYNKYGNKSQQVITSNPYKLISDIHGVGFKKADTVARKMGFEKDSYKRIKAGIRFILLEASESGHTFLPKDDLIKRASEILEVDETLIIQSLDHLILENIVIGKDNRVYLPSLYKAEINVGKELLSRVKNNRPANTTKQMSVWLSNYSKAHDWQGDSLQIEAVKKSSENSIMILTGGPGTGKTTTLKVIVTFFKDHGSKITLAAPTGRAANRLSESTGLKATTIHRLLEYNPHTPKKPFQKNSEDQLETDIVICDEISMIDIQLMANLLEAIPQTASVIFVGDNDQLPSVGAGNVLSDLINSKTVPHINLKTVFRQAAASRIVTAAHEIKNNSVPNLLNNKSDNFFMLEKNNPNECLGTILDLVSKRLPERKKLDPFKDIQVLTPMHKGLLGTESLNNNLQSILNQNSNGLSRGNTVYKKGDKVMQIRNNYDTGVFNGDIGFIVSIDENELAVDFNQNIATYSKENLDELTLAYCITIHKSQGSEFNTVILPLSTQHFIMLKKNLIYTAITRARELCILVGSKKAFALAVRSTDVETRFSYLDEILKDGSF